MQELPHRYSLDAAASHNGALTLESPGLPPLENAAPAEFGGPGDRWSPETMIAGALAGCFILSFRAIARASSVAWVRIECPTEALLERRDGVTQFTEFTLRPRVEVPAGVEREKVLRVIRKTERGCLIANSLRAAITVEPDIVEAEGGEAAAA